MANRRMFSKEVIRTDKFLEMPQTAQCLYFHLGIEADDDGFISPKMVMRTLGSNEDDLKILIAKGFIIPFESGVIVIRHWKTHNYIQSDRYRKTLYQDEYKRACEDNVYILDTQIRLDKIRLDKKRASSFKNKPYYDGKEMRFSKGKWWVLPKGGGAWLEFAGKEKDIEWK
jgi:hypothetical protein